MKMRIRNKILITICSLMLVSLAAQIIFNQFFSKSFFIYQQKSIISEAYEYIKEQYNEDLTNVNTVAEELQDTYGIKTVISENSEVVYSSGYSFFKKPPKQPGNRMFHNIDFTSNPSVALIEGPAIAGDTERLQLSGKFSYGGREVLVFLALQIASIENSITVFTKANIYISMAVLLIGILITLFVSKNISAPITKIETVSKKIASLDFSCAADESNPIIEIASLARSVNQMSRQLDESMRELSLANQALQKDIDYRKQIEGLRRDFIASVSHEMKTPLALLQIYTENLKNNIFGIDKDYYCDTILEETEKLNQMVSEMLEISSIDSGFIKMKFEKFNFSELCQDILHQYQPILDRYHAEIAITDDISITGDMKYLERATRNILNNAVQHTKDGDHIRVVLKRIGRQATLDIYNQGKPIAEEDLEHIWDAFYRTDKSGTHNRKNNIGLGLYIVKTVMEKHSGNYRVSNQNDGVLVSVILEIAE